MMPACVWTSSSWAREIVGSVQPRAYGEGSKRANRYNKLQHLSTSWIGVDELDATQLVGDIFSSSDIMAKAQCGDSPEEEENEPGALMHHWSQAQSDPSNYEEDEFALVEPFTGRSGALAPTKVCNSASHP